MCQYFIHFYGWIILHLVDVTTLCLSIHLEIDIWIVYIVWALWIMLLWTLVYKYPSAFIFGAYTQKWVIMDHNLCLNFWGTSKFSTMAAPFCSPTSNTRGFQFLQIIVNVCYSLFFSFSPPSGSEVMSHCNFYLHIPDDWWCWAYFHGIVEHLNVFFGEMSMQVLCPVFSWVACVSIELSEFFIYLTLDTSEI